MIPAKLIKVLTNTVSDTGKSLAKIKLPVQAFDEALNIATDVEKAEIGRLMKLHDVVDNDDGYKYLTKKNVDIQSAKNKASAAINTAVENSYNTQAGVVSNSSSDIGNTLTLSSELSRATIPDAMLDSFAKTNNVKGVVSLAIEDKYFSTLPDKLTWAGKKVSNSAARFVGNVKMGLSKELAEDLVEIPTLNKYQEDRMKKIFNKAYDDIIKDFTKEESAAYDWFMDYHDMNKKAFEFSPNGLILADGTVKPATVRVMDSLMATRELLDTAWHLSNTSKNRQLVRNGFKITESGSLVKPTKAEYKTKIGKYKWTKELEQQGYQVFKKEDKVAGKSSKVILSKAEVDALKDIPNDYQSIIYRNGYSPRVNEQPWIISRIGKNEKGQYTFGHIGAARSKFSAEEAVQRGKNANDGSVYFAHRKNSNELSFTKETIDTLDSLSDEQLSLLKKYMVESGIDTKHVENLSRLKSFFSHKTRSTMNARGGILMEADTLFKEGVAPAPAKIMPSKQAIHQHLMATANYTAHAEFNNMLENQFVEEWGEFISGGRWNDPIATGRRGKNGRDWLQAKYIQSQIKRIQNHASGIDEWIDSAVINTMDRVVESKAGRFINQYYDTMAKRFPALEKFGVPTPSQLGAATKSMVAQTKLGLWSISQIPVQASAMLNVIGMTNPKHTAMAVADMMSVFLPDVLRLPRTAEAAKLRKLLTDSGFVAGFDMLELQAVGSKSSLLGSRQLRKLANSNLIPYQIGEGSVRALAWFAEYRKALAEIASGKLKVVPESAEFLNVVSKRASVPALNMSRMNQPLVARGLLGVPGQFQQFVVHQADLMFFSKNTTLTQKAGITGAWAGAFGMSGVPMVHDFMAAAEWAGAEFWEEPQAVGMFNRWKEELLSEIEDKEVRNFIRNYSEGGFLAALSEGKSTIAHRTGLSRYISEMIVGSSVPDLLFGPTYAVISGLFDDTSYTIDNIPKFIEYVRKDDQKAISLGMELTKRNLNQLTGLRNIAGAMEAVLTGKIMDVKGRLISDDPDFGDIVRVGIGIGLGEQHERFLRKGDLRRRTALIKDIMWEYSSKIGQLYNNQPDVARELMNEYSIKISAYNPKLVKPFLSIATREIMARRADAGDYEAMTMINKYSTYYSQQELELIREAFEK